MTRESRHIPRTPLVATAALVVAFLAALLPAAANAASPYVLSFSTEPATSSGPGVVLNPAPVVHVVDQSAVPQPGVFVVIAIQPGTGTSGASMTCGTAVQLTDLSGNATFSNCSINLPGTSYELLASEAQGATAVSSPFDIPGSLTDQAVFTGGPSSEGVGQVFTTNPTVTVETPTAVPDTGVTATFQLGLGSNPGGGVLSCTGGLQVTTSGGVATFTGCSVSAAANGYTLTATATSVSPPMTLNQAVSAPFNVGPGVTSQLVFVATPTSAVPGQAFAVNPEVAIEDQNGNVVTTEIATISLAIGANPTGGVLDCSGGPQMTTTSGVATFTGCEISIAGDGYSLLASPVSTSPPITLGTAVSPAFNVDASTAGLVFTASPSTVGAGQAFPADVSVAVEDSLGNVTTAVTATVGLSIGTNPGGGTLSCASGLQVATVNGVATFSGCSVSSPGTGYTLLADALDTSPPTAMNEAVSAPFSVTGASSELSLAASKGVITLGDPVTFDIGFGAAGAGRTVEIDASPDQATWSSIGTVTLDSNGNATFDHQPSSNAWYRASFAGASDLQPATSGTVRVVVRQTALLRPAAPEKGHVTTRGSAITFTTTVQPFGPELPAANVMFVLYHWIGASWVLSASKTEAIDSSGRAEWTWNADTDGLWYVRTIADPTPVNANSAWSPVQEYTVK